MAGRDTQLHPPLFSFANLTVCPPNLPHPKLPLCKSINTAAKSVSHMQCPLTIGFTSSNFSLAYFLRRGEGLDSNRGERKLQLPSPCFRPSSVHQPQFKQKGLRRLQERTHHIPCKEKRDRKNPSTQILCSQ